MKKTKLLYRYAGIIDHIYICEHIHEAGMSYNNNNNVYRSTRAHELSSIY